ncbi:MAG: Hint domain-containing protein, partial [Planktomarina sp.]
TATQLITLNYDTGASSGNEIGHVIELFNGTDYITYITPEDGTDYGNIISIDTNLVSGFGPVDCSDVDTNDYVTLVPPPGACLVYDFVKTNSAMPNFGDDVTVVDGEILGVEEPLWFSGGDASLIEVGDQMSSGGTTYDVTGVEAHSMEITYNDGADTTTIPMLAVEVFDGAETFTYYVPVDGTNYPDITEMEVVGELDVGDFSGKKLYDENDDVTIICFAKGSRITTITGPVAVENLDIGDRVLTADNGFQEVRWIGKRTVSGRHQFAPIKICKGTFGAERDLYVSPQHRVLIKDWRNDVILGTSEALVAAKHLVDGETIVTDTCEEVTYFHVLFDAHEIIFSEGLASESFHPGQDAVAGLAKEAREELFTLFPELASDPSDFGGSARVTMKKHEVAALFH